jgi:hypothetical protein
MSATRPVAQWRTTMPLQGVSRCCRRLFRDKGCHQLHRTVWLQVQRPVGSGAALPSAAARWRPRWGHQPPTAPPPTGSCRQLLPGPDRQSMECASAATSVLCHSLSLERMCQVPHPPSPASERPPCLTAYPHALRTFCSRSYNYNCVGAWYSAGCGGGRYYICQTAIYNYPCRVGDSLRWLGRPPTIGAGTVACMAYHHG